MADQPQTTGDSLVPWRLRAAFGLLVVALVALPATVGAIGGLTLMILSVLAESAAFLLCSIITYIGTGNGRN